METRMANAGSPRPPLFPLVRHLSTKATTIFLRLPLTPNQITFGSLAAGLLSAWCLAQSDHHLSIAGAAALILCYVLDNCDGEVARARGLGSRFGAELDDFSDWVVHAVLFLAIGLATENSRADTIWWWLGVAAAGGATINYTLVKIRDLWMPEPMAPTDSDSPRSTPFPKEFRQRLVYIFRELFRADFCFILLALAIFDQVWILLPLAAIGSQVYWLSAFIEGARRFHV